MKKFLTQKIQEQENSSREHLFETIQDATFNAENVLDKINSQDSTVDWPIESTSTNHQKVILRDIGFWPEFVSDQIRLTLLELGPIQIKNIYFPLYKQNRAFSTIITKN